MNKKRVDKKLFYEEESGNFYWVKETPKKFFIDWVEHKCSDGQLLDQNVRWKCLVTNKDNKSQHCLKEYTDDKLLVYPLRAGLPFYLEKATQEHIQKEIEYCKEWGVSFDYYDNLKQFI